MITDAASCAKRKPISSGSAGVLIGATMFQLVPVRSSTAFSALVANSIRVESASGGSNRRSRKSANGPRSTNAAAAGTSTTFVRDIRRT